MENKELVLKVLGENEELKSSEIAEKSGLNKKIVDKIMDELKKENAIISPKRCYWTINR